MNKSRCFTRKDVVNIRSCVSLKCTGFFIFIFSFWNFCFSQDSPLPAQTHAHSFKEGEQFEFRIRYGFFNASYASLTLSKDTLFGKPVFHAKGYGRTTGLARLFFKVEDYYDSYFDIQTGLPYWFIRDIDEGGYTKDIEIFFDHEKQEAKVHDKKKNTRNTFSTARQVQDLISAFYYLRSQYPREGLQEGESFSINMFFDNENYVFKLKYLGKEKVRSAFGKIRCMKFRPIVQAGRVFKDQESVTLWISDDKNRIPIRLQADIAVGSIKVDLESFKSLKHPFEKE